VTDLGTTNIWLGVMAVVAVLEALVVIAIGIGGFLAYRRVMTVVNELEQRHVVPLATRANAILDDIKIVTAKVQMQTSRVDHAITGTMDRVDETAQQVRLTLREQVARIAAIGRSVWAVVDSLRGTMRRPARREPYADTGTARGF
jgi:uncharacterized protein YabE (DUF348 family)